MTLRNHARFATALGLTGMLALLGGCGVVDDVLTVENPSQIPVTEINQKTLIPILVNGAIGDFTHMYDDPFIWRGSMLTDEQVTGINWEQTARLNIRIVRYEEGDADLMFGSISRALRQAEDATTRLRTLLDAPNSDKRLATTLAFTGYSYVIMGEAMCQAVVSSVDPVTGDITAGDHFLSPDSLFRRALPAFQEAVTVATAANDTAILNLARVGLARAYLNLNDMANTRTWAGLVPAGFKYTLEYAASPAPPRQNNVLWTRETGSNHVLGMSPWFLQGTFGDSVKVQPDPRIQHTIYWSKGHNALTLLYKPYQGLRFSGYSGKTIGSPGVKAGTDVKLYEAGTGIILANYLEAQHDYAEADGPTAATLAFVNARQAAGNQTVDNTLSGAGLMAELRKQRARDLFLGGFRLGDLRRWRRFGVGDFFPTGPHVNTAVSPSTWPGYQDATCYPIPQPELQANKNEAIRSFIPSSKDPG